MIALVSIIKAVCLLILLLCAFIGAFGAQTQPLDDHDDTKIYLFKVTSKGATYYYTDYSFGCGALDKTFNAAFAFAILSWITITAGVVVAIIAVFNRDMIPSIVCVVVSGAAWLFLTISCALVVALFYTKYCGASESFDSIARYDYGFGFLVLSWFMTTCWFVFEALSHLNLSPSVTHHRHKVTRNEPITITTTA